MKPLIIGIAGGTGSGKTTLVNRLLEQFGEDISVLPHDSYYAAHHELTLEERQALNKDLDVQQVPQLLVLEDEDALHQDDLVGGQGYRLVGAVVDGVVVDGTLDGLTRLQVSEILDHPVGVKGGGVVVVYTDADVRILRRLTRDVKDRGRSLDSVVEQYLSTVKPMHDQFVEPSKRYADVIVPEGGKNLVALMMIIQRIAYHIEHGDIVSEQ